MRKSPVLLVFLRIDRLSSISIVPLVADLIYVLVPIRFYLLRCDVYSEIQTAAPL